MALTYLENRHNVFNTPWTPERDEILKELWAQGYSASQIASKFNGAKITRCAVIGRVHRLKLPGRKPREPGPPYLRKRKPRRRRAGAVPKPPAPPPRPKPPPPPPPGLQPKMRRLPFFKLKSQHCHWPLGELLEPPRLFCAADTEGEVYCPAHMRAARVRGKQDA